MPTKPMRVLLIEDDRMIAEGVRTALRQEGYAVDWLADGGDADTSLRATRFDCILLDLGLPRMNGLRCCVHCVAAATTRRC